MANEKRVFVSTGFGLEEFPPIKRYGVDSEDVILRFAVKGGRGGHLAVFEYRAEDVEKLVSWLTQRALDASPQEPQSDEPQGSRQ